MKITLPIKNFSSQQQIFDCPTQYVIVPKGRRFGATNGSANNFISMAIRRKFSRGLWVDTVNANIEKYVERYFIPKLNKLSKQGDKWNWLKQQKILTILDSYIDFRSADNPENIEGFAYDYAFLNEAGIILKNEYLWYNAIQPMLLDYKAKAIIAGTPKGQGLFHTLYERGLDVNQPNYTSFKFSTYDNPYMPRAGIAEMISTMPQRVVSQEIYAEFLDDNGVVFRGVKEIAILDRNNTPEVDYTHMYVIGCDIAKLVDYTVISVYDRTDNHQVFQMKFNNLEYPAIRGRIQHVSRKYNNALVYLDSTGVGEPTYDDLSRAGVPVEPIHLTNELKKQIIEKLSNWIELKHFRMLNDPDSINELNSFTYDISEKTGRVFYNAPIGFHDDIVIANALAVWGMQPVLHKMPTHEMSIIERDIAAKKANLPEDDYEEIDDWGLYGNSDN
jgi:hypothetical protein